VVFKSIQRVTFFDLAFKLNVNIVTNNKVIINADDHAYKVYGPFNYISDFK